MGRFTTMPSAPRSLCSQTKVRVREKFGSDIAGMAMRKWLVRLIVCIGRQSAYFTAPRRARRRRLDAAFPRAVPRLFYSFAALFFCCPNAQSRVRIQCARETLER